MRSRYLGLVVVALAAGVLIYWLTARSSTTPSSNAGSTAATPSAPSSPPRPAEQVSSEQEQKELALIATIASELALTADETKELRESELELQAKRRTLFAELAAKRVNTEQVSNQLHQLRADMHARIERALGMERAQRVRDRMREEATRVGQ